MYDIDTIDAYILGKLSSQEKNNFETTLASDTKLQAAVNKRKELVLIAQLVGGNERKKALKTLLTDADAKHDLLEQLAIKTDNTESTQKPTPQNDSTESTQKPNPQKGERVKLMPYLLAAACILAICFVMIFQTESSLNPLVTDYYSPYSITVRSSDTPTPKEKADQLYTDKDYKAAIPLLQQLATGNEEAQLMLGTALLETNQPKTALTQFESLTNSPLFADHAKWYAALTHLQLNQQPKAKELLNVLTNQTEYSEKAKELLEKLN